MNRLQNERGVALIAALLVMTMMSAMLAGFLVMVNADQAAGGIERDQTQAYAAAHAGVEKLTADLGQVFAGNFSPTGAQLAALTTAGGEPTIPGITYVRPNGASGYRIGFTPDVNGNPTVADPGGSLIGAGPFQGLIGLITPYDIEVTARTIGNAEVRMRREMQTIAIPVFQFGLFSENNLSFFAGPNFAFGGKVHTNQNLFLKQDNNATLTLQDRVTAVGDIVRNRLSNGVVSHNGTVRIARAAGCPAAPAGHRGVLRSGFGIQYRHAGSRHSGRRQSVGRRAERLYRRHRFRNLPEDHAGGDRRTPLGGTRDARHERCRAGRGR